MPKKTTDHLLIKGEIKARICRREATPSCQPAGEVAFAPGSDAEFHEMLPASLNTGNPRELDYFVELMSPKGRSGGLSNAAPVLAGSAPAPVAGLSAEVRADGVALHWIGGEAGAVRLHRRLLTPPLPKKTSAAGPMTPSPEPLLRDLLVENPPAGQTSGALDRSAQFGESYEYTAQRVERIAVGGPNGKTSLELAGEVSAPIHVDVADTFPPTVPQGLVAVLVPEDKTIDLSWQPDSDPYTDRYLAGYIVYRADSDGAWTRISGAQPLPGPAYRDATVQEGHSYRYAVTAVDLAGHESKYSAEAHETVPQP
jgi:hypothetical protein